jgi:polyadenylate-binding protein 2
MPLNAVLRTCPCPDLDTLGCGVAPQVLRKRTNVPGLKARGRGRGRGRSGGGYFGARGGGGAFTPRGRGGYRGRGRGRGYSPY